jgi:hypothetical protein
MRSSTKVLSNSGDREARQSLQEHAIIEQRFPAFATYWRTAGFRSFALWKEPVMCGSRTEPPCSTTTSSSLDSSTRGRRWCQAGRPRLFCACSTGLTKSQATLADSLSQSRWPALRRSRCDQFQTSSGRSGGTAAVRRSGTPPQPRLRDYSDRNDRSNRSPYQPWLRGSAFPEDHIVDKQT